jgi:hypothetical protein
LVFHFYFFPIKTGSKSAEKGSIFKRFLEFTMPFFFSDNSFVSSHQNVKLQSQLSENEEINKNLIRFKSGISSSMANQNSENFFISKKISEKFINFVLPLAGRWDIFKRFMLNFESVCLDNLNESNIRLVVVLFENEQNNEMVSDESLTQSDKNKFRQSELIKIMFSKLRQKYQGKMRENTLNLIVSQSNFSRSIGCELGAASFGSNQLLFFIDVDVLFTNEFLLRVRFNTIQYKQVYYPIVFSEYDPDDIMDAIKFLTNKTDKIKQTHKQRVKTSHFDYGCEDGYWRQFGFGIVAVYNSDLRMVGWFRHEYCRLGQRRRGFVRKIRQIEFDHF